MARKDIIQGAHHSLERFKEESPEWLEEARAVVTEWGNQEYLLTAVAKGLKAAFERGQRTKQAPAVKRRSRSPEPEPETAQRKRRTRPSTR